MGSKNIGTLVETTGVMEHTGLQVQQQQVFPYRFHLKLEHNCMLEMVWIFTRSGCYSC